MVITAISWLLLWILFQSVWTPVIPVVFVFLYNMAWVRVNAAVLQLSYKQPSGSPNPNFASFSLSQDSCGDGEKAVEE